MTHGGFLIALRLLQNHIAGVFAILTGLCTMGSPVAFIFAVMVSVGMYLPAPGTDDINVVLVNGNRKNIPITFSIHKGAGINR